MAKIIDGIEYIPKADAEIIIKSVEKHYENAICRVRKIGKWEKTRCKNVEIHSLETYDDGVGFRCSICANAFKTESVARYKFCPNCGAKMVEEQTGEAEE